MVRDQELKVCEDQLGWRKVGDEIIVLDLTSSKYLSINPSGAIMWQRLVDGATVDELASSLVETFKVSRDRALEDATDFVSVCLERGLVNEMAANC